MRVLVLGGYGNFGRIICERLCRMDGADVWIAGRDAPKANAVARELGARAITLDASAPDLAARLRACGAQLVISTAGPFQSQNYRVPAACVAAGSHYIDIADARRFVCDIGQLNATALEHDVLVLSGASSVPTLSSAVVDAHLPQFSQLDAIEHGICASERVPGVATVRAVLSYCGEPIRTWRDGAWCTSHGWQNLRRECLPEPMSARWFANCDVPDLELFPAHYAGVRHVRFQAGLGLRTTQWGLWMLAGLRRARLVPRIDRFADVLHSGGRILECIGDGVSGMFVRLRGRDREGQPLELRWYLTVERNEGPNIPCLAAVALARKLIRGELQLRGATPAISVLALSEYLAELHGLPFKVIVESSR